MYTSGRRGVQGIPQVQIIAAAIGVSPIIYVLVAALVSRVTAPFDVKAPAIVFDALAGLGVVFGIAAFVFRSVMLSPRSAARLAGGDTMGYFTRIILIAFAGAEAPAIAGLVRFLCLRSWTAFLCLAAVSLALSVSMFPTQAAYDEMCAGLETTPDS